MESDQKMEKERIELGNLCPDIVDSIFSRIPLKSLTKLKGVSKPWCSFITRFRHCNPLTTSSGLVVNLKHTNTTSKDTLYESIFFKLHDHHCSRHGELPCSLHKSFTHKHPNLIDSCNGLLLYATVENGSWFYHICSPFLDQFTALPCAHEESRPACTSLAFDGFHYNKFRVICFFWEEADAIEGQINCKIFSSPTWQWKEQSAAILNSNLLLEDGFVRGQCFLSSVYCRGRLYWLWSICMLVYDDERGVFKLIPLPRNQSRRANRNLYLKKLLWESDGKIQYCEPVDEGLYIWTYHGDDDGLKCDGESIDSSLIWQLNRFVLMEDMKLQRSFKCTMCKKMRMRCVIGPCAFNDDLQVLFLHVSPGTIIAYSFETQEFEHAWSFDDRENNYCIFSTKEDHPRILKICPFQFDSVNLLALNRLLFASK